MQNRWIEGNTPKQNGLYWTTVINGGEETVKTQETPMRFENGAWYIHGGRFFADNIIAYMECRKPEPYDPKKIGFSNEFYIKVTHVNGSISYYAKQLAPIEWSKIGYSDKEKADRAMKRLKKLQLEETDGKSVNDIYEVVTGDGDTV